MLSVIAALAGGVGAARFLEGLVRVVDPSSVTVVANTADDDEFWGLHVSPDLDSIIYTLADASDRERGWGLRNETYNTLAALRRFEGPTWFTLGDRDLATHCFRTERLRRGASLSQVTAEIAAAWNLQIRLLPMSDDPIRTQIGTDASGDEWLSMQEWFVRERTRPPVRAVRFVGAERAQPAPGVLPALESAGTIIVCPSNPLVSIDPILAVPGIRDVLVRRREHVVAVSPIVGGNAIKGPADRMLAAQGLESSCVTVAHRYQDWCATFVIDAVDAASAHAIESLGMQPVVTDTIMDRPEVTAALARRTLAARP